MGLFLVGFLSMIVGMVAIPLAGWGAAYVFAAGIWLLPVASLPGLAFLVTILIWRIRSGQWYFGEVA
jgi:hypothetical protein